MRTSRYALLILDMMNTFTFPEGEMLLPHAKLCAEKIKLLKERFNKNNLPVIYVNDNFGKWKSDWKGIYEKCADDDCDGKEIAQMLRPDKEDYFVLKPRHSGFYS